MKLATFPADLLARLERTPLLRRLDRLSFPLAITLGIASGVAVGFGLLAEQQLYGVTMLIVIAALLGLGAAAIAWSAQPLEVWDQPWLEPGPPFDMMALPGGSFFMGSPAREPDRLPSERRHRVTVSPFSIARTAVTKAQYRDVLELDDAPGPGDDDHPVTEVSWLDAIAFCNRLSEYKGLPPCYRIEGKAVEWIGDRGYRLPTEAEWEYACRAGTETPWSFGDDPSQLGEHAWFRDNSERRAHTVATKEPNPWDLYDMHGNVWEWCWDRYGDYLRRHQRDPRGPSSGARRVLRGGSAWYEPVDLRSADRSWHVPGIRDGDIGFRCVRSSRASL